MPRRAVVDASVLLALVLDKTRAGELEAALDGLTGEEPLHSPALVVSEVGQGLWRAVRTGAISELGAGQAAQAIDALGLVLHQPPRLAELLRLVSRVGHPSVYDATYLALALQLRAPLATADRRFARAAETAGVAVLGIS